VIEVFVTGVGVHGPGFANWAEAMPVLVGQRKLSWDPPPLPPPSLLGPNERRRTSAVVRLALAVAQQAAEMADLQPDEARSVFASANGDGAIIHALLQTLASSERQVSPTQFHNSVHNAPAGYWSIGTRSRGSACTLGCHDSTAAAALLKAAAEAQVERMPVLLCMYDAPLPEPLGRTRPTSHVFGAAFVLTPHPRDAPLARLRLEWRSAPAWCEESVPDGFELRSLHHANPAARMLPVLQTIARRDSRTLAMPLLDGWVEVEVVPC
jgi:hypothetical protein